ncbi:MAG: quinolinate synthetase [candidate division Zixibacteria bacterium SM23_73_2]|nr:MAG: quinolinate synthetase [candidate division Zixibacteria bacterium SM23_73_2]
MNQNQKISDKIQNLKKQRNAVILAHNYQIGEVQDIADFVGDSLDLSQQAARTDARVIVFCGVHFMAETAAILSPEKTVLMPDVNAGCAMANMITPRQFAELKKEHPEAVYVCYVNCTAETKAECDYCCTSANAIKVVQAIPQKKKIVFLPDKYLGSYVKSQTKRDLILWDGYCPTHRRILPEDILKKKAAHPKAEVLVHPECTPEVIAMADQVLSTSGICRHARESESEEFIIGTEIGILHRLEKENPKKKFYPASELSDCPNMKLNNLEKILWSLEDMVYEVKVPEGIAKRAKKSIDRMLEIT